MTRSGVLRRLLVAAAAAAAASGPLPGAPSGVRITESVEHYPIVADSLSGFVRALKRMQAESDELGSIARTRSAMQVSYRLVPLSPGCRIERLDVSLDVVVRLPRWDPPGPVRPEIRDHWERMRAGIGIHEQGHRDNAVEAVTRLDHRLRSLVPGPADDCATLERKILRERIKAQMRFQNIDAAYDRRTRNGLTQMPASPPDD